MEKAYIKKVSWAEINKKVSSVNLELAKIIDELDPGADFSLYLASYPYGSLIVENGVFHVPLNNGLIVPLHDSRVNSTLKEELDFSDSCMPPGVVLSNSYELFINTKSHILPVLINYPGSIFGLWKMLEFSSFFHPVKLFNITAGSRCIFMLPNISDLALHKNLKRDFNIRQSPPKDLLDQWEIFRNISHHKATECEWKCEILYFSKKWFESLKKNIEWQSLLLFMMKNVWNSCAYERNTLFYDFVVSHAQENRNLKPNPYLLDTLQHLLMIGAGTGTGFCAGVNDICAPLEMLQKVYLESYGLKKYAPVIMHPVHFSLCGKCQPVYYSLSMPTTIKFSPRSRKISSTLDDLGDLRHILKVFMDEVSRGHLQVEDTVIGQLARNVNFEFYHNKIDPNGEIVLSRKIPETDFSIQKILEQYQGREFSDSGTFARGCVQISSLSDGVF